MSEAPEIPEATNPFDKRVALTIAMIAVILSFVENCGDNAKTEAIIQTNAASNQWAYYQAKSVKGQMSNMHASILENANAANSAGSAAEVEKLRKQSDRYESEKAEIKVTAEKSEAIAKRSMEIDDQCDMSALFLQIAVVMCSVAILGHQPSLWYVGMILSSIGSVIGFRAFFM